MADKSHWFYDLDVLSVSDYTAASPRGCTNELSVAEMMKNLEPHRDLLRRIARVYGKPLVFGECGCGPRRFQAASPSGCDRSQPADPQEQANYYEAFIRTFKDEPWCRVFYWWRWNDHTLADLALGLCAFCVGTAGGVLMAKLMNVFSSKDNKVNPLIGSAVVAGILYTLCR